MHPLLLLLLHLLATFFLLQPAAAQPSSSCWPRPKACGDLNITYPFWLEESGKPACGPPGFQVKCNSSGAFLSRTPYQAYRVVAIFAENKSLHVVDINLPLDTGCPAPTFNVSIVPPPLVFSANNSDLLVLGKCTGASPKVPAGFRSLSCDNSSFVRLGDGRNFTRDHIDGGIPLGCLFSVVPILGVGALDGNGDDYLRSMRNGFLLEWTDAPAGDCPECIERGGEMSIRMVVGIVFGAIGGLFVAGVLFLVWHKRRRKKQVGAPNGFMRSESSMQSFSKDLELGGSPHIFTYEELEEATDGFSDSKELGDGGFGTVYKGKLRDGRVVAVKRLYKNNYKRVEQFINEVDILSRLLHQNLVILYGCTSRSSRDLMLVYEYIPNGTVADHLHGPRASERGLMWPVRMNIAIETAGALAYLHAVEIIHRDVKTNNILLDNNFHVKVADFGLSRLYPLEVTHISTVPQGTPGYVDPVYHQCYKLTDKSDVYSFGVVLVELISSKPAVDMSRSHSEINLANMALNRIQNHEVEQLVDPELGYGTDEETKRMIDLVAELAFQCLQLERDLRPSIKEVVEALNCIKNGESPGKKVDVNSSPKEDTHLLRNGIQYSPDSV
nr:unnamed protein product [Digitaria exilis]